MSDDGEEGKRAEIRCKALCRESVVGLEFASRIYQTQGNDRAEIHTSGGDSAAEDTPRLEKDKRKMKHSRGRAHNSPSRASLEKRVSLLRVSGDRRE